MNTKIDPLARYTQPTPSKNNSAYRNSIGNAISIIDDEIDIWRSMDAQMDNSVTVEDAIVVEHVQREFEPRADHHWKPVQLSSISTKTIGLQSNPLKRSSHLSEGKPNPTASSSDLSPPRRRRIPTDDIKHDLSPPRRRVVSSSSSEPNSHSPKLNSTSMDTRIKHERPMDLSLHGNKPSHLKNIISRRSDASIVKMESSVNEAKRQHPLAMTDEESGRHAATVYRDISGRIIDAKAEKERLKKAEREALAKKQAQIEWAKGSVQKHELNHQQHMEEKMKSLPFARYADDAEMNNEMKRKTHWNDPMRNNSSDDNHQTVASFAPTDSVSLPKYRGPAAAPNRFSIKPGFQWDGVDRGNGYEARWFAAMAAKASREEQSYQWNTEDM